MSTFVSNTQSPTLQTTQTTETTQASSMSLTKKRILNPEEDSTTAVSKKARRAVPVFKPELYNYTRNLPHILATKDKDGNDMVQIFNSVKNPYRVMAPPGICKYVNLGKGGNIGAHAWCSEEKTATMGFVYTSASFPMIDGESAESHQKRCKKFGDLQQDFVKFLKDTQTTAMTKFFNTCSVLKNTYVKKAKVVLPNDSSEEKVNEMALKLMLKGAKSPIKEDNGSFEFQVKCGAYRNTQGAFIPREVNVYNGNDVKCPHLDTIQPGDIRSGAVLRPVFTMRVYSTPGYKTFGTTYQLENRYVIFHKNGSGSGTAGSAVRKTDDQLKIRSYQMKGHTNKSGNYNIYINDLNGERYQHRAPKMKTKYCDLENGTLGKFPGVTEQTAKYTATFVEDDVRLRPKSPIGLRFGLDAPNQYPA